MSASFSNMSINVMCDINIPKAKFLLSRLSGGAVDPVQSAVLYLQSSVGVTNNSYPWRGRARQRLLAG